MCVRVCCHFFKYNFECFNKLGFEVFLMKFYLPFVCLFVSVFFWGGRELGLSFTRIGYCHTGEDFCSTGFSTFGSEIVRGYKRNGILRYFILFLSIYLLYKYLNPATTGRRASTSRRETSMKEKRIGEEGQTFHHNAGD